MSVDQIALHSGLEDDWMDRVTRDTFLVSVSVHIEFGGIIVKVGSAVKWERELGYRRCELPRHPVRNVTQLSVCVGVSRFLLLYWHFSLFLENVWIVDDSDGIDIRLPCLDLDKKLPLGWDDLVGRVVDDSYIPRYDMFFFFFLNSI